MYILYSLYRYANTRVYDTMINFAMYINEKTISQNMYTYCSAQAEKAHITSKYILYQIQIIQIYIIGLYYIVLY